MVTDKIYLGDAYELIKGLPDNSVDLIVTDPPYQINDIHESGVLNGRFKSANALKGGGILKDRYKPVTGRGINEQRGGCFMQDVGELGIADGIDISILDEWVRVMRKINIYVWCNKEQILPYLEFFAKERGCNFDLFIWAKDAPIPFCGTHYLKDKEYCLYFWEQGADVHVPFERGKTVYFTAKNIADKKDYGHPTIKPLEIISNFIENSTSEGAVVLDPFVGSGTTAVAAKQLNRHYIGFEINPHFYQVAVDRLNGVTQKEKRAGYVQETLF